MRTLSLYTTFAAVFFAWGAHHAYAQSSDWPADMTSYGIFQWGKTGNNWVVIDDQSFYFSNTLRVRDISGVLLSNAAQIKPGTPVKFLRELRGQEVYVLRIQLLDELPILADENDEEEGLQQLPGAQGRGL